MKKIRPAIEITIFIILIFSIGCSRNTSPLSPSTDLGVENSKDTLLMGISDTSDDGKIIGGTAALGLFQISIDVDNLTGELMPMRTSSVSDVLESVDITSFLSIQPCVDCVKIQSISLNNANDLVLSIGIKHPYGYGDETKDITGKNRADLHLFNVEGMIVGESGISINFNGLGEKADIYRLLNADGYSKYLDTSLDALFPTTATIHPYILHFDQYGPGNFHKDNEFGFESVTYPLPFGNLVMPMGSDYDFKDYILRNPGGKTLDFIFAVNCTFGLSVVTMVDRFKPDYRLPQFNKKSASEIDVNIKEFNLVPGDTESTVEIEVRVLDVNHGVATGTTRETMAHDSSIQKIIIDVPGMLLEPLTIENPTASSGNGHAPELPLVYDITLQNTAGGSASKYAGLVKIIDSYPPASNTSTGIAGKDGISRVTPGTPVLDGLFEISEFATYQTFIITSPGGDPTCDIRTDPSYAVFEQGTPLILDGSGSEDDGYIKSYEWDLDYDGTVFNTDETGMTIEVYLCEPGQRMVALQVTDDDQNKDTCSIPVTVNASTDPIAEWGEDSKILDSANFEPFILNTSSRAIATYKNDVYIVMNSNLPENASENIYFMSSEDKGETWSQAIQVTDYPSNHKAWTREANLAIDRSNGDIYINFESDSPSYQATSIYKFDVFAVRSQTRGNSWSAPVKVNPEASGQSDQIAGSIAIDDSENPSTIYIAYENRASSGDYHIYVAKAESSAPATWTQVKIDDSAKKSMHPSIFVNPQDKSVNVGWVNPKNLGGNGDVLFDRSEDKGATWGTDLVVYNVNTNNSNIGPFETCLAISPDTGIPGIMWRDTNSSTSNCTHRFAKATASDGASWGNSVDLSDGTTLYCWAGTLTVVYEGTWAAIFEQDHARDKNWYAMFTQSQDDGVTWSTPLRVDDPGVDNAGWVFGLSLALDECKRAHLVWGDAREDDGKLVLYYDSTD